MIDVAELLVALVDAVPLCAGGPEAGISIDVESMEVELPIETCLGDGASLLASFPRGRLATAFDPALGRISARFGSSEPDVGSG